MEIIGGCLCGAVKYKVNKMNFKAYHCHCSICQRASGGIFSTYINLHRDEVIWVKGGPSYYNSSSKAKRGFCNSCGSSICYESLGSNKIDICVGSINEKSKLKLVGHNGIESRLTNFAYEDELPKFECED